MEVLIIIGGLFALIVLLIVLYARASRAGERTRRTLAEENHEAIERSAERQARPIPTGSKLARRMRRRRKS